MQSYSFDEGAVLGGPVLFKEPDEELARRKKTERILWIGLPVMIITCLSLPFIIELMYPKLIPGVSEISVAIVGSLFILPFYTGLYHQYPRTRTMVYKNGISLGYGKKPYYRFSDLHYVEAYTSTDSEGYNIDFICLTSSDGEVKLYNKTLRNKEIYHILTDTMKKQFPEQKKGMPWTKDAETLISSMPGPKGPVHYKIEQLALQQHLKEIDLEFIHLNWLQVAKEARFSYEFKNLAKKRWGSS